jgi:RimJ/RimL family protein N-acetyltransferase
MHVYLATDRLLLRRFTPDDLDDLCALNSDPAVMRYVNAGGVPMSRDELATDYLPAYLAYYTHGERYGFWVAVEQASGAFLGWFHFRPPSDGAPDEPELGYRLRAAAWGHGYATEGSRALLHKGFSEFGVPRVVASALVDNAASRRVLEKLGFRQTQTFLINGEGLVDAEAVGYVLERADWERLAAGRLAGSTGPAA